MSDPKGYLSIPQAAKAVGYQGNSGVQRLRRLLKAKEAALGTQIMIRMMGTERQQLRVTMDMLRRHCPELFSRRDEVAVELAEEFEKIRDDISELFQRQDQIAKAIQAIRNRVK